MKDISESRPGKRSRQPAILRLCALFSPREYLSMKIQALVARPCGALCACVRSELTVIEKTWMTAITHVLIGVRVRYTDMNARSPHGAHAFVIMHMFFERMCMREILRTRRPCQVTSSTSRIRDRLCIYIFHYYSHSLQLNDPGESPEHRKIT
jgi:hypothetical protein